MLVPMMQQALQQKRGRWGFTLVELLVVIAIIGILTAIIFGVAGYATRKADRSKAVSDIEKLKNAVEEYKVNTGIYWPSNAVATSRLSGVIFSNALARYGTDLNFTDPWGNYYQYSKLATYQYKIWSYGPDRLDTNDNIDSTSGYY